MDRVLEVLMGLSLTVIGNACIAMGIHLMKIKG